MNPQLQAIGELLRTQDNRLTQNPMFCVQTKTTSKRSRWQTVMVAFTEEGCKEYLRKNGHNLTEPRIYVESFNRCPEMIAIREYLMSLPKPVVEKEAVKL